MNRTLGDPGAAAGSQRSSSFLPAGVHAKEYPYQADSAGETESNQPARPPRVGQEIRCDPKGEAPRERRTGNRCQTPRDLQQGERREETESVNAHADEPARASQRGDEPRGRARTLPKIMPCEIGIIHRACWFS